MEFEFPPDLAEQVAEPVFAEQAGQSGCWAGAAEQAPVWKSEQNTSPSLRRQGEANVETLENTS